MLFWAPLLCGFEGNFFFGGGIRGIRDLQKERNIPPPIFFITKGTGPSRAFPPPFFRRAPGPSPGRCAPPPRRPAGATSPPRPTPRRPAASAAGWGLAARSRRAARARARRAGSRFGRLGRVVSRVAAACLCRREDAKRQGRQGRYSQALSK